MNAFRRKIWPEVKKKNAFQTRAWLATRLVDYSTRRLPSSTFPLNSFVAANHCTKFTRGSTNFWEANQAAFPSILPPLQSHRVAASSSLHWSGKLPWATAHLCYLVSLRRSCSSTKPPKQIRSHPSTKESNHASCGSLSSSGHCPRLHCGILCVFVRCYSSPKWFSHRLASPSLPSTPSRRFCWTPSLMGKWVAILHLVWCYLQQETPV
jgi:hypothetical protein